MINCIIWYRRSPLRGVFTRNSIESFIDSAIHELQLKLNQSIFDLTHWKFIFIITWHCSELWEMVCTYRLWPAFRGRSRTSSTWDRLRHRNGWPYCPLRWRSAQWACHRSWLVLHILKTNGKSFFLKTYLKYEISEVHSSVLNVSTTLRPENQSGTTRNGNVLSKCSRVCQWTDFHLIIPIRLKLI